MEYQDLHPYVLSDPINSFDIYGLLNPVKYGVGLVNSIRGLLTLGKGVRAVGSGVASLPFGASLAGGAAIALGTTQIALGLGNFNRGQQQMVESQEESLENASFKNLLGLLPFGQKFDDAHEPGPIDYAEGLYHRYGRDPYDAVCEATKDYFAID